MREILFRGKRIDNGEWVYGYYVPCCLGRFPCSPCIVPDSDGVWEPIEVDPSTIGQYTDLTANGKKIFEGDVFTDGLSIWDVIYNKGSLCMNFGGQYVPLTQVLRGVIDNDIIGNIHDNPELLEANNEANMD